MRAVPGFVICATFLEFGCDKAGFCSPSPQARIRRRPDENSYYFRPPRAWIGCLACYLNGRLVGDWFDAVTADEVTTYDVHGAHSRADSHDELWVMDHENIPVKGEMSPADATAWGRAIAEVDEHLRTALLAWVEPGDYSAEEDSDLPCIPDFMERYCGEWENFEDYAVNWPMRSVCWTRSPKR